MKPNAIGYLSLAKKAGRIEIGEEAVGAAARSGHARLLILANDAPGRALRQARNMVTCTDQQMVLVPFTREELGAALGQEPHILCGNYRSGPGPGLFAALEDPQRYAGALENLTRQTRRVRQRSWRRRPTREISCAENTDISQNHRLIIQKPDQAARCPVQAAGEARRPEAIPRSRAPPSGSTVRSHMEVRNYEFYQVSSPRSGR